MSVKQVIVIRRDLKMRRGKECSQSAHASMMWLSERLRKFLYSNTLFSQDELEWLNGTFTKITLQIDSEEALLDIYNKAITQNLMVYMVTDSGKTEFDGVPTKTALAIGPNKSEEIDLITKDLKLY